MADRIAVGYGKGMNARNSPRPTVPPTQEQIAALAHEIWVERGQPAGSDIDIWLEAERQLNGQPPLRTHADPIPADPANPTPDTDPAVQGNVDRQFNNVGLRGKQPSPTSFNV